MCRPSSAFQLAALDVDDLLRVAGHVDEALVVRHRTDHVDVADLGRVLVALLVVDLDLDGLEVAVLKEAAHRLAQLVEDATHLVGRDRLVHVIRANLSGLSAFLKKLNKEIIIYN